MKHVVSLILAAACVVLAIALIYERTNRPPDHPIDTSLSAFVPTTTSEDISLLDRPIGDLRLHAAALADVIRMLAERSKVNISVDWPAIINSGLSQDAQVSITLTNATLGNALKAIADDVAGPNGRAIGNYIDAGIVNVTSAEEAARHTVTAYLNIRPLVEEILTCSGSTPWGADVKCDAPNDDFRLETRAEIMENIVHLISNTVAPASWRDNGGTVGSTHVIGGVLIISQMPENIHAVQLFLENLHQSMNARDFTSKANVDLATRPMLTNAIRIGATPFFTECINITSLLGELASGLGVRGKGRMRSENDLMLELIDVISKTISPDSWQSNGGKVADIHAIRGVMVITQTAENLAKIHDFLYQLHRAATAADGPPATQPSTDPTMRLGRTAAYFNIRTLELELGAGKPLHTPMGDEPGGTTPEVIEQIESFITTAVAPDTWQDAGGIDGTLQEVGGILVVIQKPENIEAVRTALQNLQAAILRNDFPPPVHGNGSK